MSKHILFLAPEHPAPHRDFVRALKEVGAVVSGIGHRSPRTLDPQTARWLAAYRGVSSLFDAPSLLEAARDLAARAAAAGAPIEGVEAVDERLTVPAAELRRALGLPGLSVESAVLCRDKTAMKAALRAGGVPCAESAAVSSLAEARDFAERVGFPLIAKPRAGLGAQQTYRLDTVADLERALGELGVGSEGGEAGAALEEFIEGHEGFYDTLTVGGEVRHEFISHYYPNVLPALQDRRVAPQIAATNRIDAPGYAELKELGRRVVALLGIGTSATHMEWFFGPKGLKFSEIGARPPGERLWDLHCAGNDLNLYREWALAVTTGTTDGTASRRFAAGSVQVRPDVDGVYVGHRGLAEVLERCGPWIFASSVPAPGTPTRPIRLGYLENTWLRLRHPSYDTLRGMMDLVSSRLEALARPA